MIILGIIDNYYRVRRRTKEVCECLNEEKAPCNWRFLMYIYIGLFLTIYIRKERDSEKYLVLSALSWRYFCDHILSLPSQITYSTTGEFKIKLPQKSLKGAHLEKFQSLCDWNSFFFFLIVAIIVRFVAPGYFWTEKDKDKCSRWLGKSLFIEIHSIKTKVFSLHNSALQMAMPEP